MRTTKLGLLMMVLAVAGSAQAQPDSSDCSDDGDCDEGFVCEVVGGSACAVPGFVCPDGDEPCPEPPAPPPCEPEEFRACVPAPCDNDGDCQDGWSCLKESYDNCGVSPGFDCPPGADCAVPVQEECDVEQYSECVPPWFGACTEASDCGPGFDCVPVEECSCAGSSGGSEPYNPDEGDAPPPPPEPDCSCSVGDELYCELVETPCESDSDCDADLECEDNPNRPVCETAAPPPADPDDPNDPDSAGKAAPLPPEEIDDCGGDGAERICIPPDYYGGSFGGGGIAESGVAQNDSGGVDDDDTGGGSGDPTSGGSGEEAEADGESSGNGGNCWASVVGARRDLSGAGLFAGLAALLFSRRRRSRAG